MLVFIIFVHESYVLWILLNGGSSPWLAMSHNNDAN